jgi:hypothetical protein
LARGPDPDCAWLERELADIPRRSADLPWFREEGGRWEVTERVDLEWSDELGAVPRVDLHGLDRGLARDVVTRVLAGRGRLRAPAIRFVTGAGTHSPDGKGVLGDVVERCVADVGELAMHPTGERPWRDVLLPRAGPVPASPAPGLLGRLLDGLVRGLVGALVGAFVTVVVEAFRAPGRLLARVFGRKKRKRSEPR